jgi:pimeloyl-ACP methyl ester carboxylesterase
MVSFAMVAQQVQTPYRVLASGVRLRLVDRGPVDGPAVLMLHGYTDSSFSFSRVLPLMPPHLRVIVPDQRGHGDSDRPATGYTVDDFATDALQLLDALGIDRATIVGHSMGSFVARRIAERAPARVTRLVLIGTGLTPRTPAVAELFEAVQALGDPVDEAFVREFQTSMLCHPAPPEFLARVIADSRKVPARVWRAALAGLLDYQPQWPLTCPTRVLGGDRDAVFSVSDQTAVVTSTGRATLHLEPGVGHSFQWELPERFVSLAFGIG